MIKPESSALTHATCHNPIGFPPIHFPMAIGKATNVAIDDTILERIKAVMPSYHSQKAFINQLLDEAVTLREELTTRIKKSVAE